MVKKACVFLCILVLILAAHGPARSEEKALVRFEFSRGGYLPPQSYALTVRSEGCFLSRDGGAEREIDLSVADEPRRIMEKYGVEAWNGFHETDPDVLDGEGFSLIVQFSDGSEVYASGDNAFPAGYFDAVSEFELLLNAAVVCGTYRYEKEGFGGDFTITLEKDGTYTFYEGYLSSYMGGGLWFLDYSLLYLTEENGLDMNNCFLLTEDALVFMESGSDNFPYVHVPDGGRFLPVNDPEPTAFLTFDSFDGGGPSYRAAVDDPEVVSVEQTARYGDPDHESMDGAGFTVTFAFTGRKAGQTRVTISARSPLTEDEDFTYTVTVDKALNVTLEEAPPEDGTGQ